MKKILLLSLLILMAGIGSAQTTDLLKVFSDSTCYHVAQCKIDSTSDGKLVKNIIFSFPKDSLLVEGYLESKIFKKEGDKMIVGYLSIDCKDDNHLGFNAKDLKSMSKDLVEQLNTILQTRKATITY